MSGWVPFPADAWPEVAASIFGTWPLAAAAFDLRWHFDKNGRVPGRPALVERWGWTDRRVRSLLADTAAWWDPMKGPPPEGRVQRMSSERPADVQRMSSERPAYEREYLDNLPEMSSERPADVQRMSSERPADVHTRVVAPSPSHPPSHLQDDLLFQDDRGVGSSEDPPAVQEEEDPDDPFAIATRFWTNDVAEAVSRSLRAPARGSSVGKKLTTKLRTVGLDVVLDAMRLYAWGSERGEFLRERKTTLETLLRHAEEYAELWLEEGGGEGRGQPLLCKDVFPPAPPIPFDPAPKPWVPEHKWKPPIIPGIDDFEG